MKSFKNSIDDRLSTIIAPADLAAKTRLRANSHARRTIVPVRRLITIAATFSIVAILSIGVTAAGLPQLVQLFSLVGNKAQNIAQPIVQASESNGIKMEVLAAIHSNDEAVIYLTLQDMVSSRISADVKLYDFTIGGLVLPHAEVINFDDAANIATIKITGFSDVPLDKEKMTISINTLLSHREITNNVDFGLNLSELKASNKTPQLYYPKTINESTCNFETDTLYNSVYESISPNDMAFVKPETANLPLLGVPWSYISGYGIIENSLHLQQNPNEGVGKYSSTEFYVVDENMNPIKDEKKSVTGFGQMQEQGINSYSDYYETAILLPDDVTQRDYKVLATTDTYKYEINGNWSTTFMMQQSADVKTGDCIINMNPWEITQAIVSPIFVTVKGHGLMYEYSSSPKIVVRRIDGTIVPTNGSTTSCEFGPNGDDTIMIQEQFTFPVDIKEIASITINGIDVALR